MNMSETSVKRALIWTQDLSDYRWGKILKWLLPGILLLIIALYAAGFSVNSGPSMNYLGWFYRTQWGTQPTKIGQIVRLAPPSQPIWRKYLHSSIKRVIEIAPKGYYVQGDNPEWAKDSRDWGDVPIPSDRISGVITWAWSLKRAWRSLTQEGKLYNYLEFNYEPSNIVWGTYGVYALEQENITIYSRNSNTYKRLFFDNPKLASIIKIESDGLYTLVCKGLQHRNQLPVKEFAVLGYEYIEDTISLDIEPTKRIILLAKGTKGKGELFIETKTQDNEVFSKHIQGKGFRELLLLCFPTEIITLTLKCSIPDDDGKHENEMAVHIIAPGVTK